MLVLLNGSLHVLGGRAGMFMNEKQRWDGSGSGKGEGFWKTSGDAGLIYDHGISALSGAFSSRTLQLSILIFIFCSGQFVKKR